MPARRRSRHAQWDGPRRACQARRATWRAGPVEPSGREASGRYHRGVAKRDPHDVLGIEPGATRHPDQGGLAAARAAAPSGPDRRRSGGIARRDAADGRDQRGLRGADARAARSGPSWRAAGAGRGGGRAGACRRTRTAPAQAPGRPAAATADPTGHRPGRHDAKRSGRATNPSDRAPPAGARPPSRRPAAAARPPLDEREPPRASTPTGPLARSAAPQLPAGRRARRSTEALDVELPFGKFHGHTLGQVAAFEPSYIDWLASDDHPRSGAVAAARVVRDDLDDRGVVRRARPPGDRAGRSTA